MFAPPPALEATVFSTLPEELKCNGQASEWTFGKSNPNMGSFLEGPSFDRNGDLLVTDIPFGRVFRVDAAGNFRVIADFDGEPNGLAIHQDGTLYIADHKNGLITVNPSTGNMDVLLHRIRREGFKGLNDTLFDLDGNLYFTDQGQTGMQDPTGRVYRRCPNGDIDLLVDTVPSPNGMAISPDGRTLYLAVTRANQIWRLPLHPDGSTTKVNIFLQLSGGLTGPDGLAIDEAGNLVVCHCGLGTVWLFNPLGEPIYRIRTPSGLDPTAACYGGPENKTLFITESSSGSILTVDLPVPGMKMFSHA